MSLYSIQVKNLSKRYRLGARGEIESRHQRGFHRGRRGQRAEDLSQRIRLGENGFVLDGLGELRSNGSLVRAELKQGLREIAGGQLPRIPGSGGQALIARVELLLDKLRHRGARGAGAQNAQLAQERQHLGRAHRICPQESRDRRS